MAKAPTIGETQVALSISQFNRLLDLERDNFLNSMEAVITRSRAGGMTDEAIVKSLQADFEVGGGLFGGLKGRIDKQISGLMEDLSNKEKEAVFLDELSDVDNQKEIWIATLINTCEDCIALHGVIQTRAEWEAEGVPNVRNTICTYRGTCHCSLEPVDSLSEDDMKSITEPIKLQREQIAAYQKERGRLSAGYKKQLLGQANNPGSVVNKSPE